MANLSLLARIADSGHSGADVKRRSYRDREAHVEIGRGGMLEAFAVEAEAVQELVDEGYLAAEIIGFNWQRVRATEKARLRLEQASRAVAGPPEPESLGPAYAIAEPY